MPANDKNHQLNNGVTRRARTRGLSQRLNLPEELRDKPLSGEPTTEVSDKPAPVVPPQQIIDDTPQTRRLGVTDGLLPVGVQLQKRYKILGVRGVGGMGAVYKAQDQRFAGVVRICAVKEMINTATDPELREMIIRNFEREAGILASLNHQAIPQVHDFFSEQSRSYLVMEFIEGKDLETRIAEQEGFFTERDVINWAVQICDVLTYLHSHKPRPIIFRDIKPANIMLDNHNRVRLVDFGIAKLFHSGEKGTTVGTEGYSPPEQYRGISEPRGDVYALGATLHHVLSKQDPRLEPPFSFNERPIYNTNPAVSPELVAVVARALEYDPNQRWGSAEEFKRALISAAGDTASSIHQSTPLVSSETDTLVKPIWRFACEDEVRAGVAVDENYVYVSSYDHNIYALDIEEGKFVWKFPAEGGIAGSPCIADDLVVFGSVDKTIYGLDRTNGRLQWTSPTKGRIFSSATYEFGHLFIGSDDRNLYAIHQPSGRVAWNYTADGEVRSKPFVHENLILFTCNMGVVYALSLSREIRWRFRTKRAILASPAVHEGLVFIGSMDWNFYALDIRSGWSVWRYRTGGAIASTAVVSNNMVYFGSADGNVYALDVDDGRVVWRFPTQGQVTASPAVTEDALYIGGIDGMLYCIDARSGTLRWHYQTDGPITATPVIEDGIIYIGSHDRSVYAIPA